jgi:uncharacterized protein with HEPN domain
LKALLRRLNLLSKKPKTTSKISLIFNFQITASKNIIGLRNIISHAYDSVEPEMLWGIIQKSIPVLADEIRKIKSV